MDTCHLNITLSSGYGYISFKTKADGAIAVICSLAGDTLVCEWMVTAAAMQAFASAVVSAPSMENILFLGDSAGDLRCRVTEDQHYPLRFKWKALTVALTEEDARSLTKAFQGYIGATSDSCTAAKSLDPGPVFGLEP